MDVTTILQLVKYRLGISSTVRDEYLTYVINGCIDELTNNYNIALDPTDTHHTMFLTNYATYKYKNADVVAVGGQGATGAMPQWLRFELHNMIVRSPNAV